MSLHLPLSVAQGYEGELFAPLLGKPEPELRVFHLASAGIFDSLISSEVASCAGREHEGFTASRSSTQREFGEQTPSDS